MSSCESNLDDVDFDPFPRTDIRPLTDDEVTSIASALNDAEISAGRTVEPRLPDPKVKAFARQMIDAHLSANARMSQLVIPDMSRTESPVAVTLKDQSWAADRRLAFEQTRKLDAAYLISEIKTQAQALTLINCALVSPGREQGLSLQLDQMRANVKKHLLLALQLREELALPDNGEAVVIGCVAMCARPTSGPTGPTLPEGLKATVCR